MDGTSDPTVKQTLRSQGYAPWLFLMGLFLLPLIFWQSPIERQDAIGAWELTLKKGRSCIDVNDDNTYDLTITISGVERLSKSGTWLWDYKPGEGEAILFNSFQHLTEDGSSVKNYGGYWLVAPHRSLFSRRLKLTFHPDLSSEFVKRDTPCRNAVKG